MEVELLKSITNKDLAYELGVISKLIYKNSSAHRCQKYFQSLKKIDRHMHHFSSLQLRDYLEDFLARTDVNEAKKSEIVVKLKTAEKLLLDVENSCVETVRHCMPQLALKVFVSLHTLHVNIVSNVWKHVKEIRLKIRLWVESVESLQNTMHSKTELKDGINDLQSVTGETYSEDNLHLDIGVDLGQSISRSVFMKSFNPQAANVKETEAQRIPTLQMEHGLGLLKKCSSDNMKPLNDDGSITLDTLPKTSLRYRNIPLRPKHYYSSFILYCARKKRGMYNLRRKSNLQQKSANDLNNCLFEMRTHAEEAKKFKISAIPSPTLTSNPPSDFSYV